MANPPEILLFISPIILCRVGKDLGIFHSSYSSDENKHILNKYIYLLLNKTK